MVRRATRCLDMVGPVPMPAARAACALVVVVSALLAGCDGVEKARQPTTSATAAPTTTASSESPLVAAAGRGDWETVGRLVRSGGLDGDRVGQDALGAALQGDGSPPYVDTVRVLVAAGADIGDPVGDRLLTAAVGEDDEPVERRTAERRLLRAAGSGDADGAALALRAGARTDARDGHRRTALLRAVIRDQVAVARVLVALGADPDAVDVQHDTPWLVTGVTGSVPMLEVLLPADPDLTIRNRYGGLSVIPASERGHVAYVRRVVRTGIDVNHVNDLGWTALLEAVILGDGSRRYQQIVRILLDAGADLSIADQNGVTALQHAEQQGQRAVARVLRAARPT